MSQGCNFLWPFERQVSRIRHNSKPWDEQLAPRKMPSRMCRESPAAALLWRRKGPRPPAGRSWERTDTHPNEHISEQPGGGPGRRPVGTGSRWEVRGSRVCTGLAGSCGYCEWSQQVSGRDCVAWSHGLGKSIRRKDLEKHKEPGRREQLLAHLLVTVKAYTSFLFYPFAVNT